CAVLLIAAILSMPWHAVSSAELALGTCGVAGIGYVVIVIRRTRRTMGYAPVLEDWLWHCGFPFIAYPALLGAALTLQLGLPPARPRARSQAATAPPSRPPPAAVSVHHTTRPSDPPSVRIQPARSSGRSVRLSVVASRASSSPSVPWADVPVRWSACSSVNCVARSPALRSSAS